MNEKLKQLRKRKGVTLKEVSKQLDVTISAYSNYEQGIRLPSYDILKKIAVYFEVTTDYLLDMDTNN